MYGRIDKFEPVPEGFGFCRSKGGQVDSSEEVMRLLIISSSDRVVLFEFLKEILYQVSLGVEMFVNLARLFGR